MTQEEFNNTFITALEISEMLNITRAAVSKAYQKGKLPNPIVVNNSKMLLWNRVDVTPYITRWKENLEFRRPGRPTYD